MLLTYPCTKINVHFIDAMNSVIDFGQAKGVPFIEVS